jgi:hypothetical protein
MVPQSREMLNRPALSGDLVRGALDALLTSGGDRLTRYLVSRSSATPTVPRELAQLDRVKR